MRTFPPDAAISVEDASGAVRSLNPRAEGDGWRRLVLSEMDRTLILRAPGFRASFVHVGTNSDLRIEERLLLDDGPLRLLYEVPTGSSPKGVGFLPDGRVVVTELRGRGLSVYDAAGRRGTLPIPPTGENASGFVELAILPERGEIWVSQMNANVVHVLGSEMLDYRGAVPSGGGWPKVVTPSHDERTLYVANWEGRSIGVIDAERRELVATIPIDGEPRGMATSHDGRQLWVCLFDSGAVDIVDTRSRTVVERIDRGRGAARHIVSSPDGSVMYLSDMMRGSVDVIDVSSRRVLQSRRVGRNVNTIAVSPDGRHLYVSERGRNNPQSYLIKGPEFGRIFVLDAATLESIQVVWGRHQPTGLAVNNDGTRLVATDFLDDNAAVYEVAESPFDR